MVEVQLIHSPYWTQRLEQLCTQLCN